MNDGKLTPTDRTKLQRFADWGSFDMQLMREILREGLVCQVGFQSDGQVFVVPTAYALTANALLVHGSVKSRLMRHLASGKEVCISVTLLDGLVLARSTFHHSMNYRSVMIFGHATPIRAPEEKRQALEAVVEHLIPGRSADARGPTDQELSATEIVEIPIEEGSAKVRTGPPSDDAEDISLPIWAGEVPLHLEASAPNPAPDLAAGIEAPAYVSTYHRPGE